MRIAYLTVGFPCGTTEQFLGPELVELGARHDVVVVPVRPGRCPAEDAYEGFSVSAIGIWAWPVWRELLRMVLTRPARLLAAVVTLLATAPRNAVRNLGTVPKACWLTRAVLDNDIEHVHAQWGTTPSSVALSVSRLTGVPWSFTVHRHDVLANNLLRRKARSAEFVRFPSLASLRDSQAVAGAIPPSRLLVEHMGVRVPSEAAAVDPRSRVVLCPAALNQRKGQEILIRTLSVTPDVELWLAGDGEDRDRLGELAAREGVGSRVSFLGLVPHDDLLELYASGRIWTVALATEHEGIPFALMEAMAYGIPVVATGVGGIPELLGDGAGLIVPSRTPDAFAEAFTSLGRHPREHGALAVAGRRRVMEAFELTSTTAAFERAILNRTGPGIDRAQ